eukprot:11430176-Ditylum_brightwellii.AAC.1
MIGVVGKQQGRILAGNQDKLGMGRWSYVVMTGKSKKVYVVSAYRVAQEKNSRIRTAYTQQYRIMRKKGIEQPNPRKQ